MTGIADYLQHLLALVFVLALIGAAALLARRLGLAPTLRPHAQRRLAIVATLPVDGRRRLLLIRRDDVEHLVLVGPAGETLIEQGAPALAQPGAPSCAAPS